VLSWTFTCRRCRVSRSRHISRQNIAACLRSSSRGRTIRMTNGVPGEQIPPLSYISRSPPIKCYPLYRQR